MSTSAEPVWVRDDLVIPEGELWFTAARSGGPGGQNVNKVATRVTLSFDVAGSPSLSEEQRHLIVTRLATRITKDGVLKVVAQEHRSQAENRRAAIERFTALLRAALVRKAPRVKTRATAAARARRLDRKKRRSALKRDRMARAELNE
ncbi:MAG: alternative ribosome rescue aminoacyl-tRNA hydrolase ArfB [Acidobacteriota bacterium]